MATFFTNLKRTPTELDLPTVNGLITPTQFQEMFKRAREKTSSDSRTLNYTIWKCLARDDLLASFLSVFVSLPFCMAL